MLGYSDGTGGRVGARHPTLALMSITPERRGGQDAISRGRGNAGAVGASGAADGVVTNKPTLFVVPLLTSFGIERGFTLIIGG